MLLPDASAVARFTAVVPSADTRFAAVAIESAPVPEAEWYTTPAPRVDAPVPPLATPNVPSVSFAVEWFGMSAATRERKVGVVSDPDAGPASTLFAPCDENIPVVMVLVATRSFDALSHATRPSAVRTSSRYAWVTPSA